RRPRVDWWENSRRLVQVHRLKAMENPKNLPGLGEHAWGLTACDSPKGYLVPDLFPDPLPTAGAIPDVDFAPARVHDDWGDGSIAPYGAGSAIMFEPDAAVAAMRAYRSLPGAGGRPLVWRNPSESGGYGFQDSFHLGANDGQ